MPVTASQILGEVQAIAQKLQHQRLAIARASGRSEASWRLLSAASSGGGTVPQLARRLGLTRQSVQRVADRLAEEGLARYEANPHHRRSPRLALTGAGDALLESLEQRASRSAPDLEQDFEVEDIETTLYVLRALLATL